MFLANIIANNHPIVYVDESSFGAWSERQEKAWCLKDQPVEVHINNHLYFRTIYGAIGECLNKPVFMKGKSTNQGEFKTFIKEVVKHIKCEYVGSKRPVLIMDNAGAHTAK